MQQKKAGQDFGKVYIANSVTLATRVRVDIMRLIAKKFSTEREELFVMAFSSRPILHVRTKGGDQRSVVFTFSDAVAKYGENLMEDDLGEAYRRAGVVFKGQLQQNFVVLHDKRLGEVSGYRPNSNMAAKAQKRPRASGSQGSGEKATDKKRMNGKQ